MAEESKGKATTIGHWELAGVVSEKPLPTYPDGFPEDLLSEFSEKVGRGVLCNKPFSGTEVIRLYGQEHLKTGDLIVYTSADSVFQIAAHEEKVPVPELYRICQIARQMLVGEHGVGRVIARPFITGKSGFERTANRHDYSIAPPKKTVLDHAKEKGFDVISIGKIEDIFSYCGITESHRTKSNAHGIETFLSLADRDFEGILFLNLVEFDSHFGHRNDVDGYAAALSEFDQALPAILSKMQKEDLLLITADHGCDPGTPSTDHSREYVPLLVWGNGFAGKPLGTRQSFADLAETISDYLGLGLSFGKSSFLNKENLV
jgi:phosphopentomutase